MCVSGGVWEGWLVGVRRVEEWKDSVVDACVYGSRERVVMPVGLLQRRA